MENQSFEGELHGGNPNRNPNDNPSNDPKDNLNENPSNDLKDNPPDPSKPGTDSSGDNQDQLKEDISTSADTTKANPTHNSTEQKVDDSKHTKLPLPEPIQGPDDVRFGPELQQQQTDGRGEGKERSDPSDIPLPVPMTNPAPNIQQPVAPMENPDAYNILYPAAPMAYPPPPNIPLPPVPQPNPGSDVGRPAVNVGDSGQQAPSLLSRIWHRCVDFYNRANDSAFQLPFHCILLTWPLATALLGGLSVINCSINPCLPYVMLAVGLLGTAAGVQRIYVLLYEKFVAPPRPRNFWPGVRAAEFIIWVLFIIQLYCFFEQKPSFIPGTERYCRPKIYRLNLGLIILTFATMSGWIVINGLVFIHWLLRKYARPST